MTEAEIIQIREDMRIIAIRLDTVIINVAKMQGETSAMKMMIQFLVLPLLIILGGLIGVKLAIPGT